MPVARTFEYCDSALFFTVPFLRAEEKELRIRELADRYHRLDLRIGCDVDQVDDRLALGRAAGLRDLVDLEPEAAPIVGEAQDVVVRRPDEELLDEILVLERLPRSVRDRRDAACDTSRPRCA